ncbi:aldehyde dehydrogenase family protein [Ruegeria atlantica]|uniref:Aldehyde dehydrogenase PuuC n=1 Tax=Ruegeria atlantica TaxID=81569 RepID=A0A0P1EUT8_9RHOB|nr:aldehyde dehydrogenase family protein [Ruegeria atlantica]CUH45839.1 Aldehyde dehydrogenase PuuC [Ruegeria atlantica]
MKDQLFIDGAYVAGASGEMFDVIDPSNREVFHKVACGNAEDIDMAVAAARRAFDEGPCAKPGETGNGH